MPPKERPNFSALATLAAGQQGLFTTKQAYELGYSTSLLSQGVQTKRFERIAHGVYRITHFPYFEDEAYVAAWLWSEKNGVFSHETALLLHELSDALPSKITLTVPLDWKRSKLRPPRHLLLRFADMADVESMWLKSLRVTTHRQTLIDCAIGPVSLELFQQALDQAISQKIVVERDIFIATLSRIKTR